MQSRDRLEKAVVKRKSQSLMASYTGVSKTGEGGGGHWPPPLFSSGA